MTSCPQWSWPGKKDTGGVGPRVRVVGEGMDREDGESITANAMTSRRTNVTKTNQRPAFVVYRTVEVCMHPHAYKHVYTPTEQTVHNHMSACMCKENKHGKYAQTARTRRHGQGRCRQVPGMRARRAHAGGGMACASTEKICAHKGLCSRWSLATSICVAGCVCGTCTIAQSKVRAGGLCVDYPGYYCVAQGCSQKARLAVIARALASPATPLAGRARIRRWLLPPTAMPECWPQVCVKITFKSFHGREKFIIRQPPIGFRFLVFGFWFVMPPHS